LTDKTGTPKDLTTHLEDDNKLKAPRKKARQWSTDQVSLWLQSVHPTYRSRYGDAFARNSIDGERLLAMDEKKLETLVPKKVHRLKMLKDIKALIDLEYE